MAQDIEKANAPKAPAKSINFGLNNQCLSGSLTNVIGLNQVSVNFHPDKLEGCAMLVALY
jgi:hypothetical protein